MRVQVPAVRHHGRQRGGVAAVVVQLHQLAEDQRHRPTVQQNVVGGEDKPVLTRREPDEGEPDGRFVGRGWREIFVLGIFGDVVEIDPDGAVALKLVGRLGGNAERRYFARFGRGRDVLVDQAGEGLGDQRYVEQHTTFAPIRSGVKRAGRSKRLTIGLAAPSLAPG